MSTHPLYLHLFASLLPAFQWLPKSKVLITRTVPSVTQPLPTFHQWTLSLTQLQAHWLLSASETHRLHFSLKAFPLAVPSACKALPPTPRHLPEASPPTPSSQRGLPGPLIPSHSHPIISILSCSSLHGTAAPQMILFSHFPVGCLASAPTPTPECKFCSRL